MSSARPTTDTPKDAPKPLPDAVSKTLELIGLVALYQNRQTRQFFNDQAKAAGYETGTTDDRGRYLPGALEAAISALPTPTADPT